MSSNLDIYDLEQFEMLKEPYENYMISKCGQIIVNTLTGCQIKEHLNKQTGYKVVSLFNSAKEKYLTTAMHQIIGNHFHTNIYNHPQIDHIDGDKHNNVISNLRFVSRSQNQMNRKVNPNSISGSKGVYLLKNNKWKSIITFQSKIIYLGIFSNPTSAIKARIEASHKLFGEYSNE